MSIHHTDPVSQKSISSIAHFIAQPNIREHIAQILNLVGSDVQENIQANQEHLAHLESLIRQHIELFRASEIPYNFSEYKTKILLSDARISQNLEEQVFRQKGELTPLGEAFTEYAAIIGQNVAPELFNKFWKKLIQEFGLDNLIYERKGSVGATPWGMHLDSKYKERFYAQLESMQTDDITALKISNSEYCHGLQAHEFMALVQDIGHYGIRHLDASIGHLVKGLGTFSMQEIIQFVRTAGLAGIRSLDLSGTAFAYDRPTARAIDAKGLIEMAIVAGRSGIKSLYFGQNHLERIFSLKELESFVETAGYAGIRYLSLQNNDLEDILKNVDDISHFLEVAGRAGIRSLDLGQNVFRSIKNFPKDSLHKVLARASAAGIKSLHLANSLSLTLTELEQLDMAHTYGIHVTNKFDDYKFHE